MIIRVNDIKLNYEVRGRGNKDLIFLHGNEEDWRIYKNIVEYLERDFTMYFIDSRGHGQSGDVDILTYEDMCEDVAAFIKAMILDKPCVFGFSDGGNVALMLGIRHPECVGDLIVAGANSSIEGLKDVLGELEQEYEKTGSKYIALMLNGPTLTTKELKTIASRVWVLRGEHDLISRDHTMFFTKAIPNAKYIEIKDADHGSYVMDNEHLARIIESIID